jgi:hypothetical protein
MATAAHSEYAKGTTDQQQTMLGIVLSNNTTKINEKVTLIGGLASGTPQTPNPIENARVTIQQLSANGTWISIGTATTEKDGEYKGMFFVLLTPRAPGVIIYRATYDGDNRFAPSVSNVVTLTVY